jgi:ankyrin repeat protein
MKLNTKTILASCLILFSALQLSAQDAQKALSEAILLSDSAGTASVLAQGADVNKSYNGDVNLRGIETKAEGYPLTMAVQTGNVGLVKLLLDKGADVKKAKTKYKVNALQLVITSPSAAFDGDPARNIPGDRDLTIAQMLIDKGIDINAKAFGKTTLALAIEYEKPKIAKLLESKGAK